MIQTETMLDIADNNRLSCLTAAIDQLMVNAIEVQTTSAPR